jgi:MoaA/NifB/PqqE/SkfB family radical SAM enzyme
MHSTLNHYDFKEIIYLKKFLFLPSSSLYKTLKQHYKSEYAPNERIVLAFQGQIPYDLLAHLQRVVQQLDITNFFIVLCNTDSKTQETLNLVHGKYSSDPTKIELCAIEIDDNHQLEGIINHRPLLNPPETMCMYPWNNLEFKPNGTVRPCCLYAEPIVDSSGKQFNMTNKKSFSVDDIYLSPAMKTLRQNFRDGIKPNGCKKCWKEEDAGKKSDRMLYNWVLRDQLYNIDYESEQIENITSIDLKLGNLCNLSCRICDDQSSSTWATETLSNLPVLTEKKKHPAYISLRQGEWPKTQLSFWDEFVKLLPNLIYCQFAGGEPLMLPYQFDVLRKAIELDCAKNITLRYNTNGTQCPDAIFDLWREFKLVHLDVSIDDVGDRFEYQRNGASWNQVIKNIRRFNQERRPNFKTQVSTAVNIMNVLYLPEICEWYNSENFDSWWINVVWTPTQFCITNMTQSARDLVLDRLTKYNFGEHQSQLDVIISIIQNSDSKNNTGFINTIKEIDSIRDQDLRLAHQEIAYAMGHVFT